MHHHSPLFNSKISINTRLLVLNIVGCCTFVIKKELFQVNLNSNIFGNTENILIMNIDE